MKLIVFLPYVIASVRSALIPDMDSDSGPSPLKIDFKVHRSNESSGENNDRFNFGKRNGYPVLIIDYADVIYYTDMNFGSNKQPGSVWIDTGSSIMWVPENNYDPSTSTTSYDTGNPFTIGYIDGTTYTGEYYLDTVEFGDSGPELSKFYFAKSSKSGSHGLLGLADLYDSSSRRDSNLIWSLHDQGLISKASYSLFLGPDHGSGSVIFGGVDTEKYTGDLVSYDVSTYQLDSRVPVESVSINGKVIPQLGEFVLDSGTSLGLVSQELLDELDVAFNSTIKNGNHYVDCDQPNDKFLEFDFGKNVIRVPFSNALARIGDTCYLGFTYNNGVQILGDAFLRNAYVYFDFSNKRVALAQALYSDSSNIISA